METLYFLRMPICLLLLWAPNCLFDAESLEVVNMITCVDKIEKIEFSPDSKYVLCAMYDRCAIQVFSLDDPSWKCRINEA